MAERLRVQAALPENPSSMPNIQMSAHHHLFFQAQGTQHPLLNSLVPAHVHARIHFSEIDTFKKSSFLSNSRYFNFFMQTKVSIAKSTYEKMRQKRKEENGIQVRQMEKQTKLKAYPWSLSQAPWVWLGVPPQLQEAEDRYTTK